MPYPKMEIVSDSSNMFQNSKISMYCSTIVHQHLWETASLWVPNLKMHSPYINGVVLCREPPPALPQAGNYPSITCNTSHYVNVMEITAPLSLPGMTQKGPHMFSGLQLCLNSQIGDRQNPWMMNVKTEGTDFISQSLIWRLGRWLGG